VAFTRWELRARAPMLPMRLFAFPRFCAGSAVIFFLNASVTGAVFFMAQFQQVSLGQDPLETGLRLLPWGVAPLLIAPRAGRLADRIGERPLIVSGLLLQAGALAGIAAVAALHLGYAGMIAPMFISGAGIGLAIPAVTKAVIGAVPPGDIGKASGVFSTMRQLGGAFGVAILAAVFTAGGSYASAAAFSDGFAPALAAAAGLALVGGLVGLVLPGRRNQVDSAPADALPSARLERTPCKRGGRRPAPGPACRSMTASGGARRAGPGAGPRCGRSWAAWPVRLR
jgi:MFS family permease